jgi:Arc/MetJ-type ribon-helix-helix transcriptional regulator
MNTATKKQRSVLNISMPATMARDVYESVEKEGFASVSEYVRHLFREHKKNTLAQQLKKERRDFQEGNGTLLTSLADLD